MAYNGLFMNSITSNTMLLHTVKEGNLLFIADILLDIAIDHIHKCIDKFEYLEDDRDPEYTPFAPETIEFEYDDLYIVIEIELRNENVTIINFCVIDNNDYEFKILAARLLKDTISYFKKENHNISSSYNQMLQIKADQADPYNQHPAMPRWHDNMQKYKDTIVSLCKKKPSDNTLIMLFKYGSAGTHFETGKSYQNVVNVIMPLIDTGVFPQINKSNKSADKARFIETLFPCHGIDNYKKGVSNYIGLSA